MVELSERVCQTKVSAFLLVHCENQIKASVSLGEEWH